MNAKKRARCLRALERRSRDIVLYREHVARAQQEGLEKTEKLLQDLLGKAVFECDRLRAKLGVGP